MIKECFEMVEIVWLIQTLSFSNISCKPLVGVAGDAGMKKLEFAATGFGEANAAGCFGPLMANFGSFSSVIFCLRRLKNTSAPLNVGVVWSTDFSNFSKKFGRRQKDNDIFCCEITKNGLHALFKDRFFEKINFSQYSYDWLLLI